MKTKSEIISIMNMAVQLIEQLTNGVGNEISDDLQECVYQLEDEWVGQFEEE